MLAHTTPEDFIRSVDQAKLERRRQRDAELALETRPLQPWERYRALVDQYDSLQDEAEHSDKKTRFALLILGSLNAINLVIAMRGDTIGLAAGEPERLSPFISPATRSYRSAAASSLLRHSSRVRTAGQTSPTALMAGGPCDFRSRC